MVSPLLRKAAVNSLVEQGKCSYRCACRLVNISRTAASYATRRAEEEKGLVEQIKEMAHGHRRYGLFVNPTLKKGCQRGGASDMHPENSAKS